MGATKKMTRADVLQRAGAAREHLQVAQERVEIVRGAAEPSAEAQVAASNSISAGIAAADAICGITLGERSNDQDHQRATDLLSIVVPDGKRLAGKLGRLLSRKSLIQYGGYCTPAVAAEALRDATTLVDALVAFGIRD